MRNKILIVLPSRGRPWQLMESIASIQRTSTGLCDILVCVDHDDPMAGWLQLPRVMCTHGPRKTFCEWVNYGVQAFLHDYWVFAWGADDVRFTTPGWDELVMQHMPNVDDMIYGPDGIQDEKLPTHPFIGCAYPRSLGYLIYPKLKHYFADNWVNQLGWITRKLKYVPELKVDHLHHCRAHGRTDLVYQTAEKLYMAADREAFHSAFQTQGSTISSEIRKKLDEYRASLPSLKACH
jgi:hypothetical protein